ncbi:hypothetical protein HCX49_03675 [Sphingobacterium kitahiroshimense]|uniref:hypothetical protein n=1 Tax=Sphingobacterium sp. B16(2022) TaxID=2914044 RepID=UPI0014397177|nr:hypothetical protein [Sphingobacterium sp. B16(2022)]NJI72295.1 hypothetical protein [Sphingobacterium sp. B16(2022)]
MAKANKKNKTVEKRAQKNQNEGKTLWARMQSSKIVDAEKPLVLGEQNLKDENIGRTHDKGPELSDTKVESKANVIKTRKKSADSVISGGAIFEKKHVVESQHVSDNKGRRTERTVKTHYIAPELFNYNSNPEKNTHVKEVMDNSNIEEDQAFKNVDDISDEERNNEKKQVENISESDQSNLDVHVPVKNEDFNKNNIPFDVTKEVYVEIHRGNIFHYYSGGLLLAAKYIKNRAFTDIQNINGDYLVLANSGSVASNIDHVLLEIDMTGLDMNAIVVQDNFALLGIPLPVTRIKSILVQNMAIKASIVNDALVFNGGFIPESIIVIKQINLKQKFDFKSSGKNTGQGYGTQIDKYDRILGLLAFLRNYDGLISEKSKVYKSLPQHFFYAMQVLDEGFGVEIVPKNTISEFYAYLFNDSCPADKSLLKWLFSRVQQAENFTDADTLEFGKVLKSAQEDTVSVRNVLSLLSRNLDRKKALQAIDELRSKSSLPLYVFAFLRNYGNLNSIEVARRDISSIYSSSFGEYAFAILGYFYGYRNLRNTDERFDQSGIASGFIKGKPAIKFQLTTKFDYTVMELVYQFVFNTQSNGSKGLVKIRENIEQEKLSGLNQKNNYSIYERLLYGKLYQHVSYIDSLGNLLEQLSFLPNEIPFVFSIGTFCYNARIRFVPYMISDWGASGFIPERVFFEKKDLFRYLSEHKENIDMEEMQLRIQLDKKMLGI